MLFDIDERFKTDSQIPIIQSEYQIIYYYDMPMLWCGINANGDTVFANIMCEGDNDDDTFRHFCFVSSKDDYRAFMAGCVCYLSLIEKSAACFICDENENGEITKIWQLPLSEIPTDFMPARGLYAPNMLQSSTQQQ